MPPYKSKFVDGSLTLPDPMEAACYKPNGSYLSRNACPTVEEMLQELDAELEADNPEPSQPGAGLQNNLTQYNQQLPIMTGVPNAQPYTFNPSVPPSYPIKSPYSKQLEEYIRHEQFKKGPKQLSDTERRALQKKWLCDNAFPNGRYTIKDGRLSELFVAFLPLEYEKPEDRIAIAEVECGNLPDIPHFYQIFSVLCHLNEKVSDPDKLCMPRQRRLEAIRDECLSDEPTDPPEGFASDNKAGWTFEVKHKYKFDVVTNTLLECNKDGSETPQLPLEGLYQLIARAHVKYKDGQVEHLSRDKTQAAVRGDRKEGIILNECVPTQIIKDFVAACPGCNKSAKRESRQKGAMTTKARGGNSGTKHRTNSKKRGGTPDSGSYSSSPKKKQAIRSTPQPVKQQNNILYQQFPTLPFRPPNPSVNNITGYPALPYGPNYDAPGFLNPSVANVDVPVVNNNGYPVGTLPGYDHIRHQPMAQQPVFQNDYQPQVALSDSGYYSPDSSIEHIHLDPQTHPISFEYQQPATVQHQYNYDDKFAPIDPDPPFRQFNPDMFVNALLAGNGAPKQNINLVRNTYQLGPPLEMPEQSELCLFQGNDNQLAPNAFARVINYNELHDESKQHASQPIQQQVRANDPMLSGDQPPNFNLNEQPNGFAFEDEHTQQYLGEGIPDDQANWFDFNAYEDSFSKPAHLIEISNYRLPNSLQCFSPTC